MEHTTCHGCGAVFAGTFCADCGQRRPRPGDFSLRRILADTWHEISDTDSRLWRSLAGLARPGLLTRAWLDYRWQQYLPPLRLYLIFSGIYFLLAWDVAFQVNVDQVLAAPEGSVPATLRGLFADPAAVDRTSDLTAVLKFLFVLPMGLCIALLHRGNRRPVGEHMIFALHYTAADFALFSLLAPVLAFTPAPLQAMVFSLSLQGAVLVLLVWAVLAVRRVYGRGWPSSILRGVLISVMDLFLSLAAGQMAILLVLQTLDRTGP